MTQRLSGQDVSVDAPLQDDSESTLLSVLSNGKESIEDVMAKKEMQALLRKTVGDFEESLSEKERTIFHGRVLDEDKLTLQEISDTLGISKERVRQIENKLKERLRLFLSSNMGAELDNWIDVDQSERE